MHIACVFYGWAQRNTRPLVPSDERQRHKLNGLLCVDALTGEEFLRLFERAKTEDVSLYLAALCLDCIELGYDKLCIILDNNTTHKQKMQTQLAEQIKQMLSRIEQQAGSAPADKQNFIKVVKKMLEDRLKELEGGNK